jgi:hypothetical protein
MLPSTLLFGYDSHNWVWLLERQKAFWCLHFGPFYIIYNYRGKIKGSGMDKL